MPSILRHGRAIPVPADDSVRIAGDSQFAFIALPSANVLHIVHMFSNRIEEYRLSDLIELEFELLALTFQNKKLVFVQLTDPQKLLISFVDGSSLGDPRGESRSCR
jgi:hypothetical protein